MHILPDSRLTDKPLFRPLTFAELIENPELFDHNLGLQQHNGAAVYSRESTNQPARRASLETQRDSLLQHCLLYNLPIAESYVESGSAAGKLSRPVLVEAIRHCRENNLILLVEDISRIYRDPEYQPRGGFQPLTPHSWKIVEAITRGVTVLTLYNEHEARSMKTKRGHKRAVPDSKKREILKRRSRGESKRSIAKICGVSFSTVQQTLKRALV